MSAAAALRIATLVAADAPRYRELMLEAYEQAADAFTSTAAERAAEPLAWWVERIASPSGRTQCFGAFDGDALVGTVALEYSTRPKTRHAALVIGMYVRPAARRRGAGALLMHAAIAAARARPGLRQLRLTVTQGNDAAVRLYQSLGFRAWGVEPMAIHTPSGDLGKVHMTRPLADEADRGYPAMLQPMQLGYIIVYVSDVPASLAFFEQAFGLHRRFLHESGTYGELDTGATTLAFAAHDIAQANLPAGYVRADASAQPLGVEIGLLTDDVPAAHARAVARGATELAAPTTKPWGQVVSYVRAPDGTLVEICTPVGG